MSRGRSLDDPIELSRLVPTDQLEEMIESIRTTVGGALAIFDRRGTKLAGSDAAGPPILDVEDAGEKIAQVAASGERADAAASLCRDMLSLVVHHANAKDLAAITHEEAMRVTFNELTEHNDRLTRAVARLEELDRLKSNFLATMSHELRTPLTSVIGYAEMMAEGLAGHITPEQKDYLTTILGKADQLLGLITSVLDVSSLESGQLALERTQLSLAELVANEVATLAFLKGHELGNGKVGVVGFCWGGTVALLSATRLGLPAADREDAFLAAMIHDCGVSSSRNRLAASGRRPRRDVGVALAP